jgi:hypothetical protein
MYYCARLSVITTSWRCQKPWGISCFSHTGSVAGMTPCSRPLAGA